MATFNERLKGLRKQRGLSQRALANELGVGSSTIAMYESGQREPDHEMTETIADYFNVDIDYLLGRSNVTLRYTDVLAEGQQTPQYYEDEVVQAVTDRLRTNPEYGVMFKAASNIRPEEVDFVTKFIEKLSD